jgi:hypothetical protein
MLFLGETSTNRMSFRRSTKSMFFGRSRHLSRLTSPLPAPSTVAPSFSLAVSKNSRAAANDHPTRSRFSDFGGAHPTAESGASRLNACRFSTDGSIELTALRMNTYEKWVGGYPPPFSASNSRTPCENTIRNSAWSQCAATGVYSGTWICSEWHPSGIVAGGWL